MLTSFLCRQRLLADSDALRVCVCVCVCLCVCVTESICQHGGVTYLKEYVRFVCEHVKDGFVCGSALRVCACVCVCVCECVCVTEIERRKENQLRSVQRLNKDLCKEET